MNRAEALERLQALVDSAAVAPKRRKPTRPTLASKQRRLESKVKRGGSRRCAGRSSTSGSADAARGGTRPTRPPP